MHKRIWISLCLLYTVFLGIIGHLLQLIEKEPAQVISSQSRWSVTVASTRGTIYDTNFRPLVNEMTELRAAVAPSEKALSLIKDATTEQQFAYLREQFAKGVPGVVRLSASMPASDELLLFNVPVRYTEQQTAPHIIGYLDSSKSRGVSGIEAAFDSLLARYSGSASALFTIDAKGSLLSGISPEVSDSTANSVGGVVLTLDKELQAIVEHIAPQYLSNGSVVILEPSSGDILASASFPSFQTNDIEASLSQDNGAFLNRSMSLFDCGSVFKIVTTAAALEQNVSSNQRFTCAGFIDVNGVRFHCHNRSGHGELDMTAAFAQSCNVYYIQLAEKIGGESLLKMAKKFGIDESIVLAESISASAGLLPSLATLVESPAALANFSFGQGYLMATPLHFARIVAAIINNGTMPTLQLVRGTLDETGAFTATDTAGESGRGVISPKTAAVLRNMMVAVVTSGTGKSAQPSTVSVAGKTATAQTGQVSSGTDVVQSWFVGYFPIDSPKYVVCVLVEEASTTKASDIFREIANEMALSNLI